jgi:hypothetical protein
MYFGLLIGDSPLCGNIQSGGNINSFPFLGLISKSLKTVFPPSFTSFKYHMKDKNLLEVP